MLKISAKIMLLLLLALSVTSVFAQDDDGSHEDMTTMTEDGEDQGLSNTAIMAISLVAGVIVAGIGWAVARNHLTILHYGIITLLVATGLIHVLYTLLDDMLLFVNGIGYLGLTLLYFLPITGKQPYKRFLNGATIIYTLITIVGYVVVHLGGHFDKIGIITKVIEIALVGLVVVYMFQKQETATQE